MPRDAKAYAEALFSVPGDEAAREARAAALEALALLLAGAWASGEGSEGQGQGHERERAGPAGFAERSVGRYLRDPGVPAEEKSGALASMAPGDSGWAAFCAVLCRAGAWDGVGSASKRYRAAVDEAAGVERALIESARPLDASTKAAIAEAWRRARGASRVELRERIAPHLLGGFRFTAGSTRYDLSVLGKLDRLRAALAEPLRRGPAPIGGTP